MRIRNGLLVSLVLVGCSGAGSQATPEPTRPATGGKGGRGGSGGGTGGATGGSTGGSAGPATGGSTGGAAVVGTGGSSGSGGTGGGGSGGSAGGAGGSGGTGGGAPADTGGTADQATPPSDVVSQPPGQCKTTPSATAGMLRLAFRQLQISGDVSSTSGGKSPTGFTEIRFVPGTTNEVFVAQKAARINHFRIEGNTATLIRRYTVPGVFAQEDCGLITFAFDPDYQTNKYLYAGYCTSATTSKVARFTVGETLAGAQDIISFSEPQSSSAYHTVGTMGFDKDKNMWLLHGEFFRGANAQNLNSPLGKLLRFVPSRASDTGGNTPAPGNPFVGMTGRNPLVYAYGLRSPWRGYLDSRGRYLFGDVGDGSAEELNLVTAPGQNFGWNGSRAGPCNNCAGLTNPISTYRIANDPYEGQGEEFLESRPRRSIWVGVQYQDCGNDRYGGDMTGVYLFGDLFAGWVRGVVIDDNGRKGTDRHLASIDGLSSWAQGPDGFLYAARFGPYGDHLTGLGIGLYRVERAP